VFWIASLACLLAMNVTVRQSEQLTLGLLFGFGLLVGLATAPTISYYATVDPEAVWEAGGATALFVAGFGAAGYATRRDLSALAARHRRPDRPVVDEAGYEPVRRKGAAMGMGFNALVLTTIRCTSGRERNAVASMGGRDPR
jgi:hypothetical protein